MTPRLSERARAKLADSTEPHRIPGLVDDVEMEAALTGRAAPETHRALRALVLAGEIAMHPVTAAMITAVGVDPIVVAYVARVAGYHVIVDADGERDLWDRLPVVVAAGLERERVNAGRAEWTEKDAALHLTTAPPDAVVAAMPGRRLQDIVDVILPDGVEATIWGDPHPDDDGGGVTLDVYVRCDPATSPRTLLKIATRVDPRYGR